MGNENKDLMVVNGAATNPNNEVGFLSNESLVALAEQAERRIKAINDIMRSALKMTTESDWVLIGGVPYLQESGATKVARLFGISSNIQDIEKETRPDGHYTFTYRGAFTLSGASIEAVGARSSYDDFFTGKEKKDKDGNIISKPKSPDEIDIRDVKLAAYTNFMNNGIKRILPGLRNLTKESLSAAGLDTNKIKGYDFNSAAPKEMGEEGQGYKSKIIAMLNEASGNNDELFKKMLKKHTSFTKSDGTEFAGYENIDKISEKAMSVTFGKVKKAYDEWKAKQPVKTQEEPPADDEGLPFK